MALGGKGCGLPKGMVGRSSPDALLVQLPTVYPGMEQCPGSFVAQTQDELWKHIELHAREAHGDDPSQYSEEEVA